MRWLYCLLLIGSPLAPHAQDILDRVVSLELRHRPLAQVLDSIGGRAHFDLSYNSTILRGDSVVSVSFRQITVRQALDRLLGKNYTYTERGNYLILLPAQPPEVTYVLTGYVIDRNTGQKLVQASVYEKEQLQSTLTDDQGFFRLRLKGRYQNPVLTVSKEWYADTAIVLRPGYDQALSVGLEPARVKELSPVLISYTRVERTRWGRFFLSSRERIQSMNIGSFFTNKPYQLSLTPGLGTHGKLSGQVTNRVSINMIGGYSAGTTGGEAGGVFNIDKKSMSGLQAAGVFNMAGGKVSGLQVAGAFNEGLDSIGGVQAAGAVNVAAGRFAGLQVAGAVNEAGLGFVGVQIAGAVNRGAQRFDGVQIAGAVNAAAGRFAGLQVAGAVNNCADTLRGVQVSGFLNRASVLKGVQIGILNMADTSEGYSIALLDLVKRGGIHRLSLSGAPVTGFTLAYKSGNQKLYDILLLGYNPSSLYSMGYGLGKEYSFRGGWGLSGELTARQLYNRHWDNLGTIYEFQPALTYRVDKRLRIFAGPSFCLHVYPADLPTDAERPTLPGLAWGSRTNAWIGFSAGIDFF